MKEHLLFIGGDELIQVFDCKKEQIVCTLADLGNWIYKILPLNDDYLLCGGDNILVVIQIKEGGLTLINTLKYDHDILDMVRVN